MEIIQENTVLTDSNIEQLKKMFGNEYEYQKIMVSLASTRKGLYAIVERKPQLEAVIRPQFKTINCLISALIVDGLPNPLN